MECLLIIDLLFIYARELLLPLWQIYAGSFLLIVLHISWGLFPFCAIFSNTRTERYGNCFIFFIITIIWIVNYSYCYIGWLDLHIMYPNDSPQHFVIHFTQWIAACRNCCSNLEKNSCVFKLFFWDAGWTLQTWGDSSISSSPSFTQSDDTKPTNIHGREFCECLWVLWFCSTLLVTIWFCWLDSSGFDWDACKTCFWFSCVGQDSFWTEYEQRTEGYSNKYWSITWNASFSSWRHAPQSGI